MQLWSCAIVNLLSGGLVDSHQISSDAANARPEWRYKWKYFLERRVSALRWWKERVQIYYFLHLILEQCHLTDFPSPTWLFSILSFTKQINFHCCFLLLTLLKVNVFQKWGDLNACIGQCKMNKTGLQPVSRPAEQPFFMLVLLRRTSFLITFYDLYFNQLAHIFYRLQFFVGLWGQLSCTASTPLNCGHSFVFLLKETLYFIEKKYISH